MIKNKQGEKKQASEEKKSAETISSSEESLSQTSEVDLTDSKDGKINLPVPISDHSVVRFDPLQKYMSEIRQYPLLTREEEHDLAVKYDQSGELETAHRLVTANLRLVVKIASDYHRYWMNLLDLVQEGNVGLMQAVKNYDPYRGVKLSSYASFWIKAYILKFIIDNWSLVKIGTTQDQRKLFFNLKKEKAKYALLGYDTDAESMAEKLNVKPELVTEMEQRMAGSDFSLNQPVGNDSDDQHIDFLRDKKKEIDDYLADEELHRLFRSRLTEFRKLIKGKEAFIFDNRLLSETPQTLNDIGNHYEISRERVRQIETRLISKLREFLQKVSPELSDIVIESSSR